MGDVHKDRQLRHTPYGIKRNRKLVKWHSEDQIHTTTWRNRKRPERKMMEDTQDGQTRAWFKVTIPYGGKYDKAWLINSIQSHCSVPFTPFDFHYFQNRAHFFVQGASTASALKDVNYTICDDHNRKICIFVNHSTAPFSVKNKLKPSEMELLKLTMDKRYDVSQQALDLQSLRFDPDLMDRDIVIILNRRNCMAATLKIIESNFPELLSLNLCNNKLYQLDGLSDITEKAPNVKILNLSKNELKSVWELGKVKGLKLEELWLEGNPLCSTFSDESAYVSAIQDCFPKLLRLDGQVLSSATTVDIDSSELMKPCKESCNGSETLKHMVLQFLQQKSLSQYLEDSRNMKTLKDPYLREELLKHTKRDIVDFLSALPKTRHDLSSILVDMWYQTVSTCFLPRAGPESQSLRPCSGAALEAWLIRKPKLTGRLHGITTRRATCSVYLPHS
nr:nuclear RNA export factor 5-like isoform X2 [Saimiri boliviensis boliviensis]